MSESSDRPNADEIDNRKVIAETSTGEVAIPKEIWDYLQLDVGSKIDFVIDCDRQVNVILLNVPVETLSGILYRPDREKVTIEEMEMAIIEGASDRT